MQNKPEIIVKKVYKKWKAGSQAQASHPDEEMLACFLEGKLPKEESEQVKVHLVSCNECAEAIASSIKLKTSLKEEAAPQELISAVKGLLKAEEKSPLLEIFLRLKEKTLEIINTTGDVLVGQELMPAPVLRSRSIKDFKDEVTILKDFKDFFVEVKIENNHGRAFNLKITAKQKDTRKVIKDLRITLLKDDVELESYISDTGIVIFEHVLLGKYKVEISNIEQRLASIMLDIKS